MNNLKVVFKIKSKNKLLLLNNKSSAVFGLANKFKAAIISLLREMKFLRLGMMINNLQKMMNLQKMIR